MEFKIAYCAGHHLGNAKGIPASMGLGNIREWTLNDQVARHFAIAALEYDGVSILRTDDSTGNKLIDIPDRCAAANKWGADIYIDMHHNGGINGGSGGGVCAFSYPNSEKGKAYRDSIYNAIIAAGGLKGNRAQPLQEKKFDSLRYSHMPAVLVEYGFMDSTTDAPIIITDAYSKLVAYATMEGIAKVAGLHKKVQTEQKPIQTAQPAEKTIDELAKEVINGLWGAGEDRKKRLGDKYEAVQKRVNEILLGKQSVPTKSIDELAREVIAGKHGSGAARKQSLGDNYEAVQKRVNELLK